MRFFSNTTLENQVSRPKTGTNLNAFGLQQPGRNTSMDSYRYGVTGMESDNEVTGNQGGSYDFGARMYDARIGRWNSTDPYEVYSPHRSPYHYCANSPIYKIDVDGRWEIEIHAYENRGKMPFAVLIARDKYGKEVFRTVVKVQGWKGRSRLAWENDTPTGVYAFESWRKDGDRDAFGPNWRIDMIGVTGEIKESRRTEIQIHGGRQEDIVGGKWRKKTNKKLRDMLYHTSGCTRMLDDDILRLKQILDELEENDPEEKEDRKVTITNDLINISGEIYLTPEDNREYEFLVSERQANYGDDQKTSELRQQMMEVFSRNITSWVLDRIINPSTEVVNSENKEDPARPSFDACPTVPGGNR